MKHCIIQVKGAPFAKLQKGLQSPACVCMQSRKIHILTITTNKKNTPEMSPSNACRVSFNCGEKGEKRDKGLALRCGGGGVWEGCRPNKHDGSEAWANKQHRQPPPCSWPRSQGVTRPTLYCPACC